MFRLVILTLLFLTSHVVQGYAEESIVFSRLSNGYWQLWSMQSDGTEQTQLTTTPVDKRDPVCMKNGKKLLYRTNNGRLFILDPATREEREILARYARINNPDYCPDTSQVIFVRFDPREMDISDIWRSDIEGKDTRLLTRDHRLKYQPAYSADCSQIVYVKAGQDAKAHHLWVMNADGEEAKQITRADKGFDVLPEFLRDGEAVIFSSNRDGEDYEIYKVNLSNGEVTVLTQNEVLDSSPAASREIDAIVYVSSHSGNQQIWRMNADGSEAVQLTDSDVESIDPHWCPASMN